VASWRLGLRRDQGRFYGGADLSSPGLGAETRGNFIGAHRRCACGAICGGAPIGSREAELPETTCRSGASVRGQHFETDRPLLLRRGQLGTVVMIYDGMHYEVEFADAQGRTYAMLPVTADNLMRVRDTPDAAVA
jgi:hypothetical protein